MGVRGPLYPKTPHPHPLSPEYRGEGSGMPKSRGTPSCFFLLLRNSSTLLECQPSKHAQTPYVNLAPGGDSLGWRMPLHGESAGSITWVRADRASMSRGNCRRLGVVERSRA